MTSRNGFELKLEIAPTSVVRADRIPLLGRLTTTARRSAEVSVYFDTEKNKLRKKGLSLRVRRIGRRHIQTINATRSFDPFGRSEWESEIASNEPDLRLAAGTALEPLVDKKLRRQLKPLFETRVRRTVYPLADSARAIDVTIDRGQIKTGAGSALVCEIELELKRGTIPELFRLARQFVRALPAQLSLKSKSDRGYQLLDADPDAAMKAGPVELTADTETRDAFVIIGRACLKQILGNRLAVAARNGAGVHQMRVGVRRLRVAMSLFGDLVNDSQTATVKGELKWLVGELAPARELEVLMSHVIDQTNTRGAFRDGVPMLSKEFAAEHAAALARAQNAVASARFRALTFETAAWLEAGPWKQPQDDLARARGDLAIELFAVEQLTQRWRKIRKKARNLAQLDARSRHRLRIQVKKLRYATEFFAGLFHGKQAASKAKFVAVLERLQDALGDLNDIAVHEDLIATMGIRRQHPSTKRAFAAGLLTGHEDARLDEAMAVATEAYAKLAKLEPFWR